MNFTVTLSVNLNDNVNVTNTEMHRAVTSNATVTVTHIVDIIVTDSGAYSNEVESLGHK